LVDLGCDVCLSSDPPLFFVIFASFIVLFGAQTLPTFQNKQTLDSPVVFFAVWIYTGAGMPTRCSVGEATGLCPAAQHDAELEFDFAEEGAGDVKACHVQGLALYEVNGPSLLAVLIFSLSL
jgi:hypothetical protein